MATTRTLERRPQWLENAMQGLAFWIGHRRAMFPHYPLVEGALVAELCNLAQGRIGEDQSLFPEVAYSKITGGSGTPGDIPAGARADLVLFAASRGDVEARGDDLAPVAAMVVEVKRASAGKRHIDEDLRRIARARASNIGMRGFLVVASESDMPSRFVKNGISCRGKFPIPDLPGWHFTVRRTTKAAASYKKLAAQHYICMLEVFRTVSP